MLYVLLNQKLTKIYKHEAGLSIVQRIDSTLGVVGGGNKAMGVPKLIHKIEWVWNYPRKSWMSAIVESR